MRNILSSQAKKYLFLVILALVAEIYLFNFRYWCTLIPEEHPVPLSEITTDESISIEENQFKLSSTNYFKFLFPYSGELKSITVSTSVSGDAAPFVYYINTVNTANNSSFKIEDYTIKQSVTVFDTTGSELFYKERISSLSDENSMFINLPSGEYYILTELKYDNSSLSGTAFIDSVDINKTIPFEFNIIRFLTITILLVIIVAFAPESTLWNKPLTSTTAILFPAVIAFFIFICIGVSNPIWAKETPAVDSYGELTKALAQGHFYTDLVPSSVLLQMEDPYNYEARKSENIDYLLDYAYYNGKYYVYFGVVPSVIAFLPYYLITGKMMSYSTCFFIVLAFFLSGLGIFLSTFIKRYYNKISYGLYFTSYTLLLLMSSINVLFYAGLNYSLPQFFAVTFLIWGLYFYTKAGFQTTLDILMISTGSFCFALIAGCRPQLVFCALLAYPLLKNKMLKKNTLRYWLAFIIPYIIVATPLMYYNYARFGSVTDFGAYYNLTVGQIHAQPFSLTGYSSALLFYLFTLPKFNSDFPWIYSHIPDLMAENVTDNMAGYFIIFPISMISLFYWPIKSRKNTSINIFRLLLIVLSFFAIAIAYFYLGIRYIFDFAILFGIESVVMLLGLEQNDKTKKIIHAIMLLSVLLGVLYYFLYFSSTYVNMLSLRISNPICWYRIYKAVCFWK